MPKVVNNKVEKMYQLTPLQEGMLFLKRLNPTSSEYIIQNIVNVEGNINADMIADGFRLLSYRYDVLRTIIFTNRKGITNQVVIAGREVECKIIDFTDKSEENQISEFDKLTKEDLKRGFDFRQETFMRVTIVKINERSFKLLWTFHHIILDGWCINILQQNLYVYLQKLASGKSFDEILEEIKLQRKIEPEYSEYIKWLGNQSIQEGEEYWKRYLSNIEDIASIKPMEKPLYDVHKTREIHTYLSEKLTKKISEKATDYKVTISEVLETAWGLLLQKYTGSKDVVFGKVVSGRNADVRGIEQMVGLFINTIPTRINCTKDITVSELLANVHENSNYSTDYDFMSLASIQALTSQKQNLINTIFVFENYFISDIDTEKSEFTISVEKSREETNYDISVSITNGENMDIKIMYAANKFGEDEVRLIGERYKKIIEEIIENPSLKVSELSITSEEEKEEILSDMVKVDAINEGITINTLLEDNINNYPDNLAVVFGEKKLTYRELDEKINILANKIKELGVKPNEIVAIEAVRSIEMIIAVYSVMRSGAAYVPIDPSYPEERKKYIIKDSNAKAILLYRNSTSYKMDNIIDLAKEETWTGDSTAVKNINKASDLAYVIYTSGTTGKPKGVLVEHKGVVNLRSFFIEKFKITSEDKVLQFANYVFDASVWEMTMALLTGAACVLIEEYVIKDIAEFEKYVEKNEVTVATLPPQFYIRTNKFKPRLLITAGSETNEEVIEKAVIDGEYINAYGPTETTVCATFWNYSDSYKENNIIPIGNAIPNMNVYILEDTKLCGIGVPGELCIAGVGLARGYINNEELNRKYFINNPYSEGKMYRTGDLARLLPDGNIEFLGRIDKQVKVRGFRIELLEVESAIRGIEGIIDAAVIVNKDGQNEDILSAFFVSDNKVDVSELRKKLIEKLPNYMVPSKLTQIEVIPTTINGKTDISALKDLEKDTNTDFEEASNELEKIICDVFKKTLNKNVVGVNDNFFLIGGHSLNAIMVINSLKEKTDIDVSIRDLFMNATPKELAFCINNKDAKEFTAIPKAEKLDYYPMSSTQKRIYLINKIDPTEVAYNMPMAFTVAGNIDSKKLEGIGQILVDRHEIFRTGFTMVNNQPVQKIYDNIKFNIEYLEIENCSEEEVNERVSSFIRPFNLEKPPLLRIGYGKRENRTILIFDVHHIIADGYSINLMLKELNALYNNQKLEPLNLQYKDYSQWMSKLDLSTQRDYWLNKFKDGIEKVDLPYDFNRPKIQSFRGSYVTKSISKETGSKIKEICSKTETTEYMVLLAAFMVLLNKYSNEENIIVGSPIAGRNHKDTENMLGAMINNIVMSGIVKSDKKFKTLLAEVKDTALKGYENSNYPFEKLVEDLNLDQDMSRNPIFDILFVLQNNEADNLNLDSHVVKRLEADNRHISKFDITVSIRPTTFAYDVDFEYCTDLFKEESIKFMLEHYISLLDDIVADIDKTIGELTMITPNEEELILNNFNDTTVEYADDKTVSQLFEEVVENIPNNTAVVYENKSISYEELNGKANYIAEKLRNLGVSPDDKVLILGDRSIELITGIYGVIKSGGAYVPIDKNYPKERIDFIIKDCNPKAILTYNANIDSGDIPVIDLNERVENWKDYKNLECIHNNKNLLYVIYTSGSTGNPKGVMLENKSVVNYCTSNKNSIFKNVIDVSDNIGSLTNITFDIFVTEIIASLLNGLTVYLASKKQQEDIFAFNDFIKSNNINALQLTPSRIKMFLGDINLLNTLKNIKCLLLGGEKVERDLVKKLSEYIDGKIIDVYGPTETTVWSTSYIIDKNNIQNSISIGKPISNTQVYIMNDNELCPIGVPGEICIAGDGLARGYINNEELTEKMFVNNPFGEGRLYKTKDVGRWLSDGNIEYYNRKDDQVKIRGNRIELGEIESALRKNPMIKDAVVIVRDNKLGEKDLFAYLISDNVIDMDMVRSELRNLIPGYMIPPFIMQVNEFPMNNSGKLDKKRLPEIIHVCSKEYVKPRDKTEKILCEIAEEVLGVSNIGIEENIFDYGMNSIMAMKMVTLGQKNKLNFTLQNIYDGGCIRKISERMHVKMIEEYTIKDTENYRRFDEMISKNKIADNIKIESREFKNVVLTGVTGYLGSHILIELLEKTDSKIYCPVRGENLENCTNRFNEIIGFYFADKYKEVLRERVEIIQFESVEKGIESLPENCDLVIHAAANTKHYGDRKGFFDSNVLFVQIMIKYVRECKAQMAYISTTSVCGLVYPGSFERDYSERDLLIDQLFTTPYVFTKFEAEKKVLEAKENGVNAFIIRVGNLTNRSTDGKSMYNIESNYFVTLLSSIIKLKAMSSSLLDDTVEMSAVDKTAEGVVVLCKNYNPEYSIFHLNNNKRVLLKDVFYELKKMGKKIDLVPDILLNYKIKRTLKNDELSKVHEVLTRTDVYDFGKPLELPMIDNNFTNHYLKLCGFEWNEDDMDYIRKFINYFEELGYWKQ